MVRRSEVLEIWVHVCHGSSPEAKILGIFSSRASHISAGNQILRCIEDGSALSVGYPIKNTWNHNSDSRLFWVPLCEKQFFHIPVYLVSLGLGPEALCANVL